MSGQSTHALSSLRPSELIGRGLDLCGTALYGVFEDTLAGRLGEEWEAKVLHSMDTTPDRDSVRDVSFQVRALMALWREAGFRDRYPPHQSRLRDRLGLVRTIRNDHAHRSGQPTVEETRQALDTLTAVVLETAPELTDDIVPLRDEALRRSAEEILATALADTDGNVAELDERLTRTEEERDAATARAEAAQRRADDAASRYEELRAELAAAESARAAAEDSVRQLQQALDAQRTDRIDVPASEGDATSPSPEANEPSVLERKLDDAIAAVAEIERVPAPVQQALDALQRLVERTRDPNGPPPALTAQVAHLLIFADRIAVAVTPPRAPNATAVTSTEWTDDVVADDPHLRAFREKVRASLPTNQDP